MDWENYSMIFLFNTCGANCDLCVVCLCQGTMYLVLHKRNLLHKFGKMLLLVLQIHLLSFAHRRTSQVPHIKVIQIFINIHFLLVRVCMLGIFLATFTYFWSLHVFLNSNCCMSMYMQDCMTTLIFVQKKLNNHDDTSKIAQMITVYLWKHILSTTLFDTFCWNYMTLYLKCYSWLYDVRD